LRMSDPCRLMRPRPAAQSQSRPATPAVTTLLPHQRCRGLPAMSRTGDVATVGVHPCLPESRHPVHRGATDSDRIDDVGVGTSVPIAHSPNGTSVPRRRIRPRITRTGSKSKSARRSTREGCFQAGPTGPDRRNCPPRMRSQTVPHAARNPQLWGSPGFRNGPPRVALWGTTGWELPVRRKLYRVNHGRRPRPGQMGPLGCRALASCRRGEDSAANRLLPARSWAGEKGSSKVVGPESAYGSRAHPPRRGRSAPGLACTHPGAHPASASGRFSFGSRSLRRKHGFPADVPEVGGRCVFRPHHASQMFAHVQRAADPVSPPRWRTDRRPVGTQRRSGVGP